MNIQFLFLFSSFSNFEFFNWSVTCWGSREWTRAHYTVGIKKAEVSTSVSEGTDRTQVVAIKVCASEAALL